MNENNRKQLLKAAISAPSADNQVPYSIAWNADNTKLFMHLKPDKCGQATDKLFTLSDLAVGAALESIVLEALTLGYKAELSIFPNGLDDKYYVAQVDFIPFDAQLEPEQAELSLAQQIPMRCTDRRFPFTGAVSHDDIDFIQSSISHPQYKLHVFDTKQSIADVIPLIYKAEKIRFEAQLLHKELFDAIVFTRKFTPTGMNLNVVGVRWFETFGFYCLSKWNILKILNLLGVSSLLAHKSVTQPIKASPALLLLSTPDVSRQAIIEAGRQMFRVWLKCTEAGLKVQIYAAPGVLSLVKPPIGKRLLTVLKKVGEDLKIITGNSEKDRHGLIFFRIGEKAGQPDKSGRCGIDDLC